MGHFHGKQGKGLDYTGFWLSNGKALVYKYLDPKDDSKTEARIITPGPGAKYFLYPVKK